MTAAIQHPLSAVRTTPRWDLYATEAVLLGTFMVSACAFAVLLEHPDSPFRVWIASSAMRRTLGGIAMGLTAIALIYSPLGKRSGALMNPAMTLAVVRLGRLAPCDAVGYIAAQFLGATAGVGVMTAVLRAWIGHPSVRFAATVPGETGVAAAWAVEFTIAFILVSVVFRSNTHPRLARITGVFAGALVATYIALVGPISGMSMNPARSFGSAVWANVWRAWWVYFTAPVLGILAATELYLRLSLRPLCARLSHDPDTPTPFPCTCLNPARAHA